MVLDLGGSLFGPGGLGVDEAREATIIVAKDGSGDTDSLSDAISMLPLGGGKIYIKEGIYISPQVDIIKSNITIQGAGKSTILSFTGAANGLDCGNNQGIIIENLYLTGATSGYLISFSNTSYSMVNHCWFESGFSAINVNAGGHCSFTNNVIISQSYPGITIIALTSNITQIRISNNHICSNGFNGIWLKAQTGTTMTYISITNNIILSNTGYGVRIHDNRCDRTLIVGNIILSNTLGGILDTGTNTLTSGNITA
jgi:hypothetical protein